MENLNSIAQSVIERAKNLQEFVVQRNIDDIPFSGEFPYALSHRQGGPACITVHALTQQEAEHRVDQWIGSQA